MPKRRGAALHRFADKAVRVASASSLTTDLPPFVVRLWWLDRYLQVRELEFWRCGTAGRLHVHSHASFIDLTSS